MYRLSVYFLCPETYIHKKREATFLLWALRGAITGNGYSPNAWARLSLGDYSNQACAGSALAGSQASM